MVIDSLLLDKLTAQAKESPRLRMNLDLRNSDGDSSQRMLNAIEPASVVPIHRHQKTSETVVVLRGRVVEGRVQKWEAYRCSSNCFNIIIYIRLSAAQFELPIIVYSGLPTR